MKLHKIILGTNIAIASSISAFQIFGSSYMSEKVKETFVFKENDKESKIPKKLSSLIDTVMNDMKLSNEKKELIKTYVCIGLDPIHHGHVSFRNTAWLGIPQNFTVDDKIHVNLTAIIDDFEVPADSPDSQTLKSCLVLSEKAKKYAIAEKIYEITESNFPIKLIIPFVTAFVTHLLVFIVLSAAKKNILKNVMYIHFNNVFLATLSYLVLYDNVNIYTQTNSNFQAASLGKSYIEGGLEYYSKIIERNKAIHKLSKKSNFSDKGEISKFSIMSRIKYKKKYDFLKEFEEKKENPSLFKYTISAFF